MMEDGTILGSENSQVPDHFNFADVIDKWALEEKVSRYYNGKRVLISVLAQQTFRILNMLTRFTFTGGRGHMNRSQGICYAIRTTYPVSFPNF